MLSDGPPAFGERYVFDASALIELELSHHITSVHDPEDRVFVPHKVFQEANTRGQRAATWLKRHSRVHVRKPLNDPRAGHLYLELRQQADPKVHDGEAEAIAFANYTGWVLVIEDRAGRAKAERHGVRCLTASQFLARWRHQ